MPARRGSGNGARAGPSNRRGTQGRIQKNTRNRQPPRRYGQSQEPEVIHNATDETQDLESESDENQHSQYGSSLPNNLPIQSPINSNPRATSSTPATPHTPSTSETIRQSHQSGNATITLDNIRQLLESHERDIVDRVVLHLQAHNPSHSHTSVPPTRRRPATGSPLLEHNRTSNRIAELENELVQLRAEQELIQNTAQAQSHLGTYHPLMPTAMADIESASGIVESVEVLFPGVERGTLTQIIENRFKPTNIYRLLATEKERAEAQRTINIGGIEFAQAERDGKESEYRMSNFFKAWAAYSGILVKLAPYSLQGDLATALLIYTMNLYDLLEKYTWDGVKAYHFQFHRKRVASGKNIYLPQEWRQLDSELIASKCFAYPIQRTSWNQPSSRAATFPSRISELPLRDSPFQPSSNNALTIPQQYSTVADRRTNYPPLYQPNALTVGPHIQPLGSQVCRNWNFRECRSTNCRHLHICINCGNSHKSVQCSHGSNRVPAQAQFNRDRGR